MLNDHKFFLLRLAKCAIVLALVFALGAVAVRGFEAFRLKGVPEDVVEFAKKYPEARSYAWNFKKYADEDFDMDVSKEMREREIPLFIQWDKRWGYKKYGSSFVGVAGCGPTCLSMVACGLNEDSSINPYVVSRYSSEQGFFEEGEGTSWDLMSAGAEHYGLKWEKGEVSADYVLTNLSPESPMICSMKPGDFTKTGHFIVLTGIDSDGKIMVNDPNSPKNSEKRWNVDALVSQMKGIWRYELENVSAGAAKKTEGKESKKENEQMRLLINGAEVPVIWETNDSVNALRELAASGLEIEMSMYGGFEQVGAIGQSIPRNDKQTTTSAGDIVLYSGNQLVMFYGSNSWAYTRLGHIKLSEKELKKILGNGDVRIRLEMN
jgi:hypothetical protein